MKLLDVTLIILFLTPSVWGQQLNERIQPNNSLTRICIEAFGHSSGEPLPSFHRLEAFINKLEQKQSDIKSDEIFLNYLFKKTHQHFLKHYREYTSFNDLIKDGSYNCLTGTALYALLLRHFNVKFEIIETNYHIFILANTADGRILFESTDPLNGFVNDDKEIEKRIAIHRRNGLTPKAGENHYHFNFNIYSVVSMTELTGLLYYNLAIEAFNNQQLNATIQYLERATTLYFSPRVKEFSNIVILSILNSKLDHSLKENCVQKIHTLQKKKLGVIASNNIN